MSFELTTKEAAVVRSWMGKCVLRTTILLGGLVVALSPTLRGADDIDEALPFVPSSANVVSLIRVQELVQTPRGMREGWTKSGAVKALAGVDNLPLNVPYVLRAAHLVSGGNGRGWSMSVFPWPKESSMVDLARHEKGEVEMIHRTAIVKSPRYGYMVRLRPELLGVVTPADRQDVARWINFANSNSQPVISDYLRDAIELNSSHIVLAFDMEDMMQPHTVQLYLMNSPAMKRQTVDMASFAEWLTGMRGIQLHARVDDKIQAELRFDFATDVDRYAETFRQVFAEFLNERGGSVYELGDALPISQGKTLRLRMALTDESLGYLMSTFPLPNSGGNQAAPAQRAAPVNANSSVKAGRSPVDLISTTTYYSDVMQALDELEKFNNRATDYYKTAAWQENVANKIEKLPVQGVDSDLVQFVSGAAHNLRALAASLRGVPTKVGALDAAVTSQVQAAGYALAYDPWYGYQYVPAGDNYVSTTSNLAKVREQQAAIVMKGAEERMKLWDLLLSERSSIRHKMVEKYPSLETMVSKK